MISEKKQHNIALIMLCATAIVWGAGFLLNKALLEVGFAELPLTLNAIRFSVAALVLLLVFCRSIKPNKTLILYGSIGGLLLFGGFALQLIGLKYTTPSSNGFFTAAYTLFVPFIAWAVNKRRPTMVMFVGILLALCGLVILNIPHETTTAQNSDDIWGNLLTLLGSLFFAAQIVLTDKALNDKKLPSVGMTVTQMCVCAIAFVIASLIFESGKYTTAQIDVGQSVWMFAIVSLLGTSFAYFAQTYGQSHLSPTEVSIVITCESPIGAILSVAFGKENLTWQMLVGGILVVGSVVFIEILAPILQKRKEK